MREGVANMKKILVIVMIIISLLMVSCVKNEDNLIELKPSSEVKLADIEGKYIIEDLTSLGKWLLMFETGDVESIPDGCQRVGLKINGIVYEMKMNPFNDGLYIAFLPEALTLNGIQEGSVVFGEAFSSLFGRDAQTLTLEKVTIEKGELNGSTLYEMTLELYVYFNTASDEGTRAYLYNGDTFLQPKYVRSSEEDGYPLELYYNARAASEIRNTDHAFRFLQARPDHETTLLVNYDANQVSVDGEFIIEDAPDDRDRIRELGTMGDMSGANAWNIVDDPLNNMFSIFVKKAELPVTYQGSNEFSMTVKGATDCDFYETATIGVFEATVSYDVTTSTELLKNARFYISHPFDGGSGTAADPYRIADWQQLAGIRNKEAYLTKQFVLINDLDDASAYYAEYASAAANGGLGWKPVGNSDTVYFSGAFNGEYSGTQYRIKDFRINRSEQGCGLFGFIGDGAELNNIIIEDAQVINGADDTGLLVGQIVNQSFVDSCSAEGTVTSTGSNAGLLIGYNQNGSLRSTHASGTVNAVSFAGMLVGKDSSGSFRECYAGEGLVSVTTAGAGGIAGYLGYSSVRTSYSLADVSGGSRAGGFFGDGVNASIENSYSTGDVSGVSEIGGFGGYSQSVTVSYSYCIGDSSGTGANIGGFRGAGSGTTTSSYWLDSTTGLNSGGATSKTDAEMRQTGTFTGWNFLGEEAWVIYAGVHTSYPYLIVNEQVPAPGYQ